MHLTLKQRKPHRAARAFSSYARLCAGIDQHVASQRLSAMASVSPRPSAPSNADSYRAAQTEKEIGKW